MPELDRIVTYQRQEQIVRQDPSTPPRLPESIRASSHSLPMTASTVARSPSR